MNKQHTKKILGSIIIKNGLFENSESFSFVSIDEERFGQKGKGTGKLTTLPKTIKRLWRRLHDKVLEVVTDEGDTNSLDL